MINKASLLKRLYKMQEQIQPKDKVGFLYSFRDVKTNKCNILCSLVDDADFDKEYNNTDEFIKEHNITTKYLKIFDFPIYPTTDNSKYLGKGGQ